MGIYMLLGLLLFILVAYKAFTVGITHDEAYSFWLVKTMSINQMGGTANNHWLNSIGIFLFTHLFQSDSIGVIRLQSLVGFVIYVVALLSFVRHMDKVVWQLLFLSIFLLNPYVLDFFSLARGYGLTMGLQMMGFYYAYKAFKSRDKKDVLKVFVWMTLALAANYSTLYIYLAFSGFYFLTLLQHRQSKADRIVWITITLQFLVIAIAVTNLFIIWHFGDLEYGGQESFISNTIFSFIESSTYGSLKENIVFLLSVLLFIFLIASSAFNVYDWIVNRKTLNWMLFLSIATILVILLIELLHYVFKTPYLVKRTSLVLFPLFGLTLFFNIRVLYGNVKDIRKGLTATVALMILLLAFNFFTNISYHYTYDWRNHEDTLQKLEDIRNDAALSKRDTANVSVYLSSSIASYLNYYHFLYPQRYYFYSFFYTPTYEDTGFKKFIGYLNKADYAIIGSAIEEQVLKRVQRNYIVLKSYPLSQSRLIKFKSPPVLNGT